MALKASIQRCLQAVLQAGKLSVPRMSRVSLLESQNNRTASWPKRSAISGPYSTQAAMQGSGDSPSELFSLVNIKVKGSDEAVLDSYTHFVTRACKILQLDISGRILLPTHIERHTLLKSPHIYKKHRAQYEVRTHGRLLQLRNVTGETAGVFLEYIQRNLPEGVSMSVEQTSLQGMPDYLQPPPEALAFLRSQETEVA